MASSAVNFPIISANLRLVVIWTGGPINPLHEGRNETTPAYFHNKFDVFHDFSVRRLNRQGVVNESFIR